MKTNEPSEEWTPGPRDMVYRPTLDMAVHTIGHTHYYMGICAHMMMLSDQLAFCKVFFA